MFSKTGSSGAKDHVSFDVHEKDFYTATIDPPAATLCFSPIYVARGKKSLIINF